MSSTLLPVAIDRWICFAVLTVIREYESEGDDYEEGDEEDEEEEEGDEDAEEAAPGMIVLDRSVSIH